MEVFNEICVLSIYYHLPLFMQFVPSASLQYNLGYSAVAITLFNILVNTAVVLKETVQGYYLITKLVCKKIGSKLGLVISPN